MDVTIYRSVKNPDMGFSINKEENTYSVWIDNYEGGEAYVTDWTYEDEFSTKEEAMEYITQLYGDVIYIQRYGNIDN
jgi:hypothetical protein